jgi:hypothetical protein
MGAGAWLKAVRGLRDKPSGEGWFVLAGPWLCPLRGAFRAQRGESPFLSFPPWPKALTVSPGKRCSGFGRSAAHFSWGRTRPPWFDLGGSGVNQLLSSLIRSASNQSARFSLMD